MKINIERFHVTKRHIRHIGVISSVFIITSWSSKRSTNLSRLTPDLELPRNLEVIEFITSFKASSIDHLRFFFSLWIS